MLTHILNAINFTIVLGVGIIAVHNFIRIKKYKKDKSELKNKISMFYPLVKSEFYEKPIMQQTVENNHEIHEINKKMENLTENYEYIKTQLDAILRGANG